MRQYWGRMPGIKVTNPDAVSYTPLLDLAAPGPQAAQVVEIED